jgi:hypothetical protein
MAANRPPADDAMLKTLNYALGNLGGRQPSWMHSATANPNPPPMLAPSHSPRRRGRPPKQRVPEPPIQAAHPSVEPPAEAHPPSNSTSPQLANVLTGHDDAHRRPVDITVFPSPTPSEDTVPMPVLRGGDGMRVKRPVEEAGAQMDKRRHVGGTGQEQAPRRPSLQQPQHHSPHPAQAHSRSPSTPHTLNRPGQPTWYTREECLGVIDAFQQSHVGASLWPPDKRRLRVLRDGVEIQDWFYLVTHQIYCLLDYNPNLLPAKVRGQPGLGQAVALMREVLGCNSTLSPVALAFFSSYPYTWETIGLRWPVVFNQKIQSFLFFVSLSSHYATLKLTCERRRFPPLAWELVQYLGIESTTLQRILFTAVLRTLWQGASLNDEALRLEHEARAVSLFQHTQADYHHRFSSTISSVGQSNPRQRTQYNEADIVHYGPQLKKVVESLESNFRRPIGSVFVPISRVQQHPQIIANETEMARRTSRHLQPHPELRGSPRNQAAPNAVVLPSQHQGQQHNVSKPFLPPPGWLQSQQRQPNPTRFSLHQAHLRSPVLRARSVESPLYHFVQGYIKAPARLPNANQAVEKWTFDLDTETIRTIATAVAAGPGEADPRLIDIGSKTVRLRCIKWPVPALAPDDHVWASTDTSWIPHSYFIFNDVTLQQRKKIHHGKDLPIDITKLVVEGENTLTMSVMAASSDTSFLDYLVAIEVLGVISHDMVKRNCAEKNRIPAAQILSEIQKKLRGSSDDDDIAIVESNLTINLRDPFSAAKMCDIPVRSRACLHNDCFDLETFLSSRPRKGDVSTADAWRCPICNADARPDCLIVDGFLEQVKRQLDGQGLSKTRAIIVHQDGAWKPKVEVRDPNSVCDRGVSDEPLSPTIIRRPSIPAEVIDISD